MQKKLIALAIASLASGAALAQTNVTIYGIADAAYLYSTGDLGPGLGSSTFSGIESGVLSSSRLGFKGEEDLGNGLKAFFQLEYHLTVDGNTGVGNTGGLNARQQFVGLSSAKLGAAAFGRQYAPAYLATARNDVYGGAIFTPQSILTVAGNNSITTNSPARFSNSVGYTSPNFSGFTAKAIYGFGETTGASADTTDNGQFGLGGNYVNGPLNVDVVYQTRQDVTTAITSSRGPTITANGKDVNEYYVGGSYDFKVARLIGSYQSQNDKNASNVDNSTWNLGVSVPVLAASAVLLTYAQTDWDQGNKGAMYNGKNQGASIGWTTDLSKRTTVYAGYTYIDNDRDASAAGLISGVRASGESNQMFLTGLRHTF